MTRVTLASLIGVALALAVGAALEPSLGRGVVAGALLAAAVSLAGIVLQRSVARRSPSKAMAASAAIFGLDLVALFVGVLVCRYVPSIAAGADWQGFLLGFAALAFLLLVLGSLDVASVLREGSRLA